MNASRLFAVLAAVALFAASPAVAAEPDPDAQRECFPREMSDKTRPKVVATSEFGNFIGTAVDRAAAEAYAQEFGLCFTDHGYWFFGHDPETNVVQQYRISAGTFSLWEPRALFCVSTQADPACSVPMTRREAREQWVRLRDFQHVLGEKAHDLMIPFIVEESEDQFETLRQRSESK